MEFISSNYSSMKLLNHLAEILLKVPLKHQKSNQIKPEPFEIKFG